MQSLGFQRQANTHPLAPNLFPPGWTVPDASRAARSLSAASPTPRVSVRIHSSPIRPASSSPRHSADFCLARRSAELSCLASAAREADRAAASAATS
jgi:hypothetical protein